MKAKLRPATLKDQKILLQLMEKYYAFDQLAFDAAKAESACRRMLEHPELGCIWLICDAESEAVLGYEVLTLSFSLEFGGIVGFIDELFLKEDCRGFGIGTQAIAHVSEYCRLHGISALRLEVTPHNQRALDLYRKIGFFDHERRLLSLDVSLELKDSSTPSPARPNRKGSFPPSL